MMKLKEQLILHRRGIMGTMIFHMVLLIYFLSTEISQARMPHVIEIDMLIPEKEEIQKEKEEKQQEVERIKRSSNEEVEEMLRSIAVNENVKSSEKHDVNEKVEDYVNEILEELHEDGNGKYKAKRDKHYKQDSLQLIKDKKEQELDSLRSTF